MNKCLILSFYFHHYRLFINALLLQSGLTDNSTMMTETIVPSWIGKKLNEQIALLISSFHIILIYYFYYTFINDS